VKPPSEEVRKTRKQFRDVRARPAFSFFYTPHGHRLRFLCSTKKHEGNTKSLRVLGFLRTTSCGFVEEKLNLFPF